MSNPVALPFMGTFMPRLDDKGRLILPAKFRDRLASGVVVTRGQERSLFVFTFAEFAEQTRRFTEAPFTDKRARDFQRMFLAGAHDEVPDKQGRIQIPALLRSYAGLDRDVVVTGLGSRLEIWDAAAWEAYSEAQAKAYSDLGEEVSPTEF